MMTDFELTKCCALTKFGCSNAAAKAVLVTLAAMSRNGSVSGYTSDQLAAVCCVQRHAFLKAVTWLEEQKLIYVKRHAGVKSMFTFNEELIASVGVLSVENDTKKLNVESVTECRIQQEKVSVESVTESVPNPSLNQCRIHNSISVESDTVYQKEKEKEKIYQTPSISSCFSSFGQNPVSAPTRWEPDEENVYDLPVQQQAAMARKVDVDIDDHDHVLTATEMVVLAAQLGYRLTRNVVIDEVAERKTLTVKMLAEACQRTRDNSGGIGYLVRILQNASKNPDAFNGVRKVPDITAENITDKQCYLFAKKLANYHPFASKNAKYMEEESAMVERFTGRLKDKEFFEHCRPTLVKLGCLKGATA